MKKNNIIVCALLALAFNSFSQKKLTIAAAANVQYVMKELVKDFKASTGIDADIILNSSGKLTAQIKEGAPYDVFVSADMKYPAEVYKSGFAPAPPKAYAKGSLVLWTTQKDINLSPDLKTLVSTQIRKIAVANPKTAPYGEASIETMNYYKVFDQLKDKLVYGESISQTNQYIVSGSADVGFTAKSIVLSDAMKGKGTWIDIDPRSYKPIEQGAVILKHGNEGNAEASKKFYDYLYSEKAKSILKKFGYI